MVVDDDGLWSLVVVLSERSSFRVRAIGLTNELLSVAPRQVALNGCQQILVRYGWKQALIIDSSHRHQLYSTGNMQQCLAASVWQQRK
jgi:hypothetical protein